MTSIQKKPVARRLRRPCGREEADGQPVEALGHDVARARCHASQRSASVDDLARLSGNANPSRERRSAVAIGIGERGVGAGEGAGGASGLGAGVAADGAGVGALKPSAR